MRTRPSPISPDGEIIDCGDEETRVTKTCRKEEENSHAQTTANNRLQRTFVFEIQAILDFIQKNNSSHNQKAIMAQGTVKQKVKTEPKKCVTREMPPPL
jgi:hypothetical protein